MTGFPAALHYFDAAFSAGRNMYSEDRVALPAEADLVRSRLGRQAEVTRDCPVQLAETRPDGAVALYRGVHCGEPWFVVVEPDTVGWKVVAADPDEAQARDSFDGRSVSE